MKDIAKLIVLRSQIVPKPLRGFDDLEDYTFDDFQREYTQDVEEYLNVCDTTILYLNNWDSSVNQYMKNCNKLINFTNALPLFNNCFFDDISNYNPFDDFRINEVSDIKNHVLPRINNSNAKYEFGHSWNSFIENQIDWYNKLTPRTFYRFCHVYRDLLKQVASELKPT